MVNYIFYFFVGLWLISGFGLWLIIELKLGLWLIIELGLWLTDISCRLRNLSAKLQQ
jgi:hypothetical protein